MVEGLRSSLIRIVLGLLTAAVFGSLPSAAQDLPSLLKHARLRRVAAEAVARDAVRLPFLPPDPLFEDAPGPVASDPPGDAAGLSADEGDGTGGWPLDTLRVVPRLERPVFRSRFADVSWAFYQGRTFDGLDTTRTWDLRSRLEAHFGPPTQTLAELDSVEALPTEAVVQFEYWLVLNDSIPMVVLDVNGPLDRGLVVATDARYREQLPALRNAVLERLVSSDRRAPYADYWYRPGRREWSVTGFDGATFFDRRIARPDPRLGRPSSVDEPARPRGR